MIQTKSANRKPSIAKIQPTSFRSLHNWHQPFHDEAFMRRAKKLTAVLPQQRRCCPQQWFLAVEVAGAALAHEVVIEAHLRVSAG
jgi:hypothetical protein